MGRGAYKIGDRVEVLDVDGWLSYYKKYLHQEGVIEAFDSGIPAVRFEDREILNIATRRLRLSLSLLRRLAQVLQLILPSAPPPQKQTIIRTFPTEEAQASYLGFSSVFEMKQAGI